MSRFLILESDLKFQSEIIEAIQSLDATHVCLTFYNFSEFEEHVKQLPPEELVDFIKFELVLIDYQIFNQNEWVEKLAYLKTNYIGEAKYCFTAFDSILTNRKFLFGLKGFNVLYKPFDPLMLKESISLALDSSDGAKPVEIKAQAAAANVGILKEIELLSICEIGFITKSDLKIPEYSISKYFSVIFSRGKQKSVWAQCLNSLEIPNMPGTFVNKFHFVGIDNDCLFQIRGYLQSHKSSRASNAVWNLLDTPNDKIISIGLIDTADDLATTLKIDLEDHFSNVRVEIILFDSSLNALEKPASKFDILICLRSDLNIEEIKSEFSLNNQIYLYLNQKISEDTFKELQPNYRDVFNFPIDRGYFYKKLKLLHNELLMKEPIDLLNVLSKEKIKASNLVKTSEVCELYLNFIYHRELAKGEFREFAFISDDENQIIELPGFCNTVTKEAAEPGQKSASFSHQFIFWGMTDHYLKEIRIWLLKTHIEKNKNKDS